MRNRNIVQKGLVELSRARHNVQRIRHNVKLSSPSPWMDYLIEDTRRALRGTMKANRQFCGEVRKALWSGDQGRFFQTRQGRVLSQIENIQDKVGSPLATCWRHEYIVRAFMAVHAMPEPLRDTMVEEVAHV